MRYAEIFYIIQPDFIAVRITHTSFTKCKKFSTACKFCVFIHRKITHGNLVNHRFFRLDFAQKPVIFPAFRRVFPHIGHNSARPVGSHRASVSIRENALAAVLDNRKIVQKSLAISALFVLENIVFSVHFSAKNLLIFRIIEPQKRFLRKRMPKPENRLFGCENRAEFSAINALFGFLQINLFHHIFQENCARRARPCTKLSGQAECSEQRGKCSSRPADYPREAAL